MKEAVIVSSARTPIGKAFRGSLNNMKSPSLLGHAIGHAVRRANIDPFEVEDVLIGTVLSAGTAGGNIARYAGLAAGLPVTVPGQTIDRQCASGLMAIAAAARQAITDKSTGETQYKEVTISRDEGNRPETTAASLAALKPVVEGGVVTAGNASQLSDGASACVVMDAALAERRGLEPLGIYRGMAVAGRAPCRGHNVRRRRHGCGGPV